MDVTERLLLRYGPRTGLTILVTLLIEISPQMVL